MSFTKGVSFHHETNASSQPNITNNISIQTKSEAVVSDNASERIEPSYVDIKVDAPHGVLSECASAHEHPNEHIEQPTINNENEFLKKVLNIYMSQKFYFSGKYLVLTPDELLDLIHTLLPDKSVVIVSNDLEIECCGCKDAPLKKVDTIWIDDEQHSRQNFKYAYSHLVSVFENYKLSIKFVRLV